MKLTPGTLYVVRWRDHVAADDGWDSETDPELPIVTNGYYYVGRLRRASGTWIKFALYRTEYEDGAEPVLTDRNAVMLESIVSIHEAGSGVQAL